FFFSSRRRHTRCLSDWSSDVCSSDYGVRIFSGMRNILTSLLIVLGFVRAAVAPQQPDTTAKARPDTTARARDTFTAERPAPARSSMNAAEKRRRYPDIIEATDLDKKAFWLARGHYVGMTVLASADEQTTYLIVRRTTSSQPEWHARWD